MRSVRHNLEKAKTTPPKTNYCEHCGRNDTKIVLHHDHRTGAFGRWSCVNCNARYPFDTFEEHMEDARRWYKV